MTTALTVGPARGFPFDFALALARGVQGRGDDSVLREIEKESERERGRNRGTRASTCFAQASTTNMSSVRLAMKRSLSGQADSGDEVEEEAAAPAPTPAPAAKKRKSTTPK